MIESPEQVYTYLKNNFKIKKATNGWWSLNCPFCDDGKDNMKLAVHLDFQYVKCWVCDYRNRFLDFVMDMEACSYFEAKQKVRSCEVSAVSFDKIKDAASSVREVSGLTLPTGYNSILDGDGSLGDRARTYLKKRGFSLKELDRMGVGYCNEINDNEDESYFGYIIIPFKTDGRLVYYIGRDYIGNFLRYKNPSKEVVGVGKGDMFFNEDALNIYGRVFMLEGWSDAMTMGRDAVSTQGWSLSKRQKFKILYSPTEELVLVPDAGEDGAGVSFYKKAVKAAIGFMDYKKVKVLDLNGLDDEKKDANALGKEAVMSVLTSTDFLDFGKAIKILQE